MASSYTEDNTKQGSLKKIEVDWIAHESTGAVTAIIPQMGAYGIVQGVEVVPGTPSPTTLYDLTVTNKHGRDVLAGGGANLSATVPAAFLPSPDNFPIDGEMTINITNNSVNSAQGKVIIYVLEF